MTKEITKTILLQRLVDRFGLREFTPSKFLLDETVIPTFDVHSDLEHWQSYYMNTGTITGIGAQSIIIVPDTVRWHLRAYSVTFVSGSVTVAGVYIKRKDSRDATDFSYLDLTAAQSTAYLRTLPEAVTLEPGDRLLVNIDGYTSDAVLRIDYDYMLEEIR